MWPKIGWHKRSRGQSRRDRLSNLSTKVNVNQEYMETFRTKSYTEMWSKVQRQIRTTNEESIPLSPFNSYLQISEFLIEPQQETLLAMINNAHLHSLVIDYFVDSLEACKICGYLLDCIDQTRSNYRIIQRAIKSTKRVPFDYAEDECQFILAEFMSYSKLENPLSGSSRVQFTAIHEVFGSMLKQLTLTHKKVTRRSRIIKICKKASKITLLAACGAVAVATLVLAVHTCVGIAATPVVICSSTSFFKRKFKSVPRLKLRSLTRLRAQLDAAAKGAYILNRDFDTMSRLIMRLHDEIEHSKAIINICSRNKNGHLLEEVVNEFENIDSCFLEQLEELEEHIYLCFVTINRGRRLVIKEIAAQQHPP